MKWQPNLRNAFLVLEDMAHSLRCQLNIKCNGDNKAPQLWSSVTDRCAQDAVTTLCQNRLTAIAIPYDISPET